MTVVILQLHNLHSIAIIDVLGVSVSIYLKTRFDVHYVWCFQCFQNWMMYSKVMFMGMLPVNVQPCDFCAHNFAQCMGVIQCFRCERHICTTLHTQLVL